MTPKLAELQAEVLAAYAAQIEAGRVYDEMRVLFERASVLNNSAAVRSNAAVDALMIELRRVAVTAHRDGFDRVAVEAGIEPTDQNYAQVRLVVDRLEDGLLTQARKLIGTK